MRQLLVACLATSCLSTLLVAQSVHDVGVHDVAWPNTSGSGSPVLQARIHYPAVTPGVNAQPLQQAGGWPVVVFLHGFSFFGRDYPAFGDSLASAGYVTVMLDTAQFSYVDLEADARAVHAEIGTANAATGTLLAGMFDLQKAALVGHSMGGAVAGYVLGNNPGYRCGLALAPVDPGGAASLVHVPFGVVVGEADQVTPPALHAMPFYDRVAPDTGIKFCYLMDTACDHMNLVGLDPSHPEVFVRTQRITKGFLGQFLRTDMRGLEPILGPDGVNEPRLTALLHAVVTPQIWSEVNLQLGTTVRVSMIAERGLCGMIGAADLVALPVPTLLGDLLVDPGSAYPLNESLLTVPRLDLLIDVPDMSTLIGSTFALQGIGATTNSPFRLGSALRLVVED